MDVTDFALNIAACANCPRRAPDADCRGSCPCTVDGVPIADHARSGECPEGRFATASAKCARCRADWHATADCPIPLDHTEEQAASGGCGCSAPAVKTLAAMPEPEALPYNPLLSRRRWRVPTLA